MRAVWPLIVFATFALVFWEANTRIRLAVDLNHIERVSHLDTSWARGLLGYDRFSALRPLDVIHAAQRGSIDEIKVLGLAGAAFEYRDQHGETALHHAIRRTPQIVGTVIDTGAAVEAKNKAGETPLFLAVKAGLVRVTDTLLARGATVFTKDSIGSTPVHWAVANGDFDLVLILLEGHTNGHKLVRNLRDHRGLSAIHIAVDTSNPEILRLLLDNQFDPNSRDPLGQTPVMRLVQRPATDERKKVFRQLLLRRINLAAHDNLGRTVYDHARSSNEPYWSQALSNRTTPE